MSESLPEVWLRGPVEGYNLMIQPVVHALLQAQEEIHVALSGFDDRFLWERPGGAASVGFHLQHLSGVLDRLFTYADGKLLSDKQLKDLSDEALPFLENVNSVALVNRLDLQINYSLGYLRNIEENTLFEIRGVGRKQVPSNVIGLLFHSAEHTMRHLGQLLVTVKIVRSGS